MRLCKEAGFAMAAAANFGGQVHRWTRRYEIPRQMVLDWPADEFAARLSEFWTG